jgi:tetrapyrrole methylase family protein/MazG family protein
MAAFEPEHPIVVVGSLEGGGFELAMATVGDIPELTGLGPDTVVYLPPVKVEPPGSFAELVRTVATLRGPDGCPWDREQDHMSLRKNVIEEAYEVVEAIEAGSAGALTEELGDLLLQIALHAQIASEAGRFDIDDVTAGIVTKLRRRHPHIFGTVEVADSDEVIANWEAIKREEKGDEGLLESVPESLPALLRAQKISRRVAHEGFDWEDVEDVWEKVHEEIDELKAARAGTPDVVEEIGDVLFTMVNVARKLGVEAETALRGACDKFARRYASMEELAQARGTSLAELETSQMEELWTQVKTGPGDDPE